MRMEAAYVKETARSAGFELCGLAPAASIDDERRFFERWLAEGRHGSLDYMSRNVDIRFDPRLMLTGARTVIVCAAACRNEFSEPGVQNAAEVRIASYGLAEDYHTSIKRMLHRIAGALADRYPGIRGRLLTDSAPLHEKRWAVQAGLGWIGRNSLLVTPGYGTFVLLGEIIVDMEADAYDAPNDADGCAGCRLCAEGCPAAALCGDRSVDARRCISRLTVEAESPDVPVTAGRLHGWIFGCEACQHVCPFNRRAAPSANPVFAPVAEMDVLTRDYWVNMDAEKFDARFGRTPLARAGMERLRRNAGVQGG